MDANATVRTLDGGLAHGRAAPPRLHPTGVPHATQYNRAHAQSGTHTLSGAPGTGA